MYCQKKRGVWLLFLLMVLSRGALLAQSDFKHPVLLVKNVLDSKIIEVFLSEADISDWGSNILPKPIIPGLAHQFTLEKSLKTARIYDISVTDEQGNTYSKYSVDIMAITLVEMTPADKEVPPEPQPAAVQAAPDAPVSQPPASSSNVNNALPDEDAIRVRLVAAAQKYLGTPYKLGAPAKPTVPPESPPSRVDCSGLIAQVYKDVTGVTIPRTSRIMFEQGKSVTESQLKPGDIIIMDSDSRDKDNGVNHVALYIGPDIVLQALSSGPRTGVVQTNIPGISTAKILGYRTFIGATMGNKQNYAPTSVTDYTFEMTMTPDKATEPLELETNTMLRFAFINQTIKATAFIYRFYRDGTDASTGENENFNIKQNEVFNSNLCIPKTAGTYLLQVYTGSLLLLERTWTVTN